MAGKAMDRIAECALAAVLGFAAAGPIGAQIVAASPPVRAEQPVRGEDPRAAAIAARRVRVQLRDVPVRDALQQVAAQAGVDLIINGALLAGIPRVTVSVVDVPAGDVFRQLLHGTGLTVVIRGTGQAALVRGARAAPQESGRIVGKVVDSVTGHPLQQVSVSVSRTRRSAVTNAEGEFALRDVPTGEQVVTARLLGYAAATRTVTVAAGTPVTTRFALAPTATVLSGVVTTATGMQHRIEVGNDIATINVDSVMRVAPVTTVTDLLESRVPGLSVLRSSGNPGDPARIRLRGPKSINGSNDPIVIVDGVRVGDAAPGSNSIPGAPHAFGAGRFDAYNQGNTAFNYAAPSALDQIDPNSIETIEVLKGPSASAMYGSDAANGVIIITTKRGRAGPVHWSVAASAGLDYLPGTYPKVYNRWATEFNGTSILCGLNQFRACPVTDSVTRFQLTDDSRFSPFARGTSSDESMTISGGASVLTYALTAGSSRQLGNLRLPAKMVDVYKAANAGQGPPQWARRPAAYTTWSGGGQLTAEPGAALRVTLQASLFHSAQQRSSLEQTVPRLIGAPDTLLGIDISQANAAWPRLNAYERVTAERLTARYAATAGWQPRPWLPVLNGTLGLNTTTSRDETLQPFGVQVLGDTTLQTNRGHFAAGVTNDMDKTLTLTTEVASWRDRVRTALGVNVNAQARNTISGQNDTLRTGYEVPATLFFGTQSVSSVATYGWFAEPRLNVASRLFITPGFRLDGGNANGSRAGVSGLPSRLSFAALFPKLNVSWVAVDRPSGRPLLGGVTLLRPRVGVGSAGVQPEVGDRLRLLVTDLHGGLMVQTLGNTQLRPERSSEVEGGIDAELWHGRVKLTATSAHQLRHDAIIAVPVAPSVGPGSNLTIKTNIGMIRNTSAEFSVIVTPIETRQLGWTVSGQWAHTANTVVRLDRDNTAIAAGFRTKIVEGYPLFGRWERPILYYADDNHDGVLTAAEVQLGDTAVFMGVQDPTTTTAISNDVRLLGGRIGLHAEFAYSGGYTQLYAAGNPANLGALLQDTALASQAAYAVAMSVDADGNYQRSYYGLIQTVSAWRFNSLSVNYQFPAAVARWFGGRMMALALQGRNLGLWTNYRGKDPNVNAFSSLDNTTADLGQIPQPRTWQLRVTLGN